MRLATVRSPRGARLHVRGASGYVDAGDATGDERLSTLMGLLALGQAGLDALAPATEGVGREIALRDFAPAMLGTGRIICFGLNYGDHARETGWMPPTWPEVFVRGPQSLVGPADDIVAPALSSQLDFEGELAVVIGRGGRYIPAERALDAVLGFSVVNEVTARDWQRASKQWTPGKNFDATMPMGPEIVTVDEVNTDDLALTTTLNGTVMQSGRTSQMLTSVGRAIEFVSSFTALAPGDVIATGTPAGVGFTRKPAVFLQPGDVVEVTIENLGTIRNRVVVEQDAPTSWPWVVPVREDGLL
jgi:acylpyruvate hydrolase